MTDSSIIAAVASPPGRAARGLVRASGTGLLEAFGRITGRSLPARTLVPVRLPLARATPTPLACRFAPEAVPLPLPALACAFPAPRSYTGDDVLELLLPGSPILLDRTLRWLLEALLNAGLPARAAGPGEFSARAWMNGRMDLDQAEGVAASIAARSDAEVRAAAALRSGRLGRQVHAWAEEIAGLLARTEAGIDFTDQEDVVAIAAGELCTGVAAVRSGIAAHLAGSVGLERQHQIPRVVLCGPPNAGKSSLFNALLGRHRTLASPEAGTTRDAIAEPLSIRSGGVRVEVLLVDSPGVEERAPESGSMEPCSPDAIDQIEAPLETRVRGSALSACLEADLLLRCRTADQPAPAATFPATSQRPGAPELHVVTKCDLHVPPGDEGAAIRTSALTGTGIERLREAIAGRIGGAADAPLAADAFVVSARSRAALEAAEAALREALSLAGAVDPASPLPRAELVAASLRTALDGLGDVTGRRDADAVLDLVFSRFCIGK